MKLVVLPTLAFAVLLSWTPISLAEPWIAVQQGLTCSTCHVNGTGGGMRTEFGAGTGRSVLPRQRTFGDTDLWDGSLGKFVRVGADVRTQYLGTIRSNGPYLGDYRLASANVYASIDVVPERVSIYLDQSVRGGARTREAFATVRSSRAGMYAKAGSFFLPFGLRFQDDAVPIRAATGINFSESDQGIEFGIEPGDFSVALAATNGAGGAADTDNGKRLSFRGSWIRRDFRLGLSASDNDLPGDQQDFLTGVFGGLRLGAWTLLVEGDRRKLRDATGLEVRQSFSHVEMLWQPARGWLLRAWGGAFDPDREFGGAKRTQVGAGVDAFLFPGVQARIWYRERNAPADIEGGRDDEAAVELHIFF